MTESDVESKMSAKDVFTCAREMKDSKFLLTAEVHFLRCLLATVLSKELGAQIVTSELVRSSAHGLFVL